MQTVSVGVYHRIRVSRQTTTLPNIILTKKMIAAKDKAPPANPTRILYLGRTAARKTRVYQRRSLRHDWR